MKWTEKRFLTLTPPNSQFNLLNLWFLSIVSRWRLWNACFTVLLKGFTQEYKTILVSHLKGIFYHYSSPTVTGVIIHHPASVFTRCKSRLSGSNASPLTGVFAVIWIICMLSVEVSSSFLVSCSSQLKPNSGHPSKLQRAVCWGSCSGCFDSLRIFLGVFCFFFNCSEQTKIAHLLMSDYLKKMCVMAAFPAGGYECKPPAFQLTSASEQEGIKTVKSCQEIAIQLAQWKTFKKRAM